jgi:hypothetical protein
MSKEFPVQATGTDAPVTRQDETAAPVGHGFTRDDSVSKRDTLNEEYPNALTGLSLSNEKILQ